MDELLESGTLECPPVLSQLKKLVRSSEDDYLHGSPREAAVEAHVTNEEARKSPSAMTSETAVSTSDGQTKVFVIDTEFSYIAGENRVFSVSIHEFSNPSEPIVNHKLPLPSSTDELWAVARRARESGKFPMACMLESNLHKHTGTGRSAHLDTITARDLAQRLDDAGFKDGVFLEYSTNACDWHAIHKFLNANGITNVMMPKENVVKSCHTVRRLLPGLKERSQETMYCLLFEDCELVSQSHNAREDSFETSEDCGEAAV